MTYELIHRPTILHRTFSRQFWTKALELGASYGWKPMGTNPPSHIDFYTLGAEWNGGYLTNDGQTIQAEDAASLAKALEQSLKEIAEVNPPVNWDSYFALDDDLPDWLSPEEREMIEEGLYDGLLDTLGTDPLVFFAGDEKKHLKDFIRFCRLGSFEIR